MGLHLIPDVLPFFVSAFAATLLTVSIAYLIGHSALLLVGLRLESFEEEAACSIASGFVILALLVFLLGIRGLLNVWAFVLGIVVLLAASVILSLRANPPFGLLRGVSRSHLLVALCVFLILLPLFLLPLYPPTESDAIRYHLAIAKHYLQTGSVQPTPQYRYAVFPQLVEMLFTGALMTGGDRLAQCVSFVFLLVTALAIVAFVRWKGHGLSSIWAAALLLSNAAVLALGGIAYTDMALMAFVTLAVLSFERWRQDGDSAWLVFSGAMAGSAAGTKYSALFFPLILGALVIAASFRRRSLRPFLALSVSCVLLALPWYLYNAYHTGNPVWPFLSQFFGHAYWNEADIQGQTADLLATNVTGTSVGALLQLPWNLFAHGEYFRADGELSLSLLIGVPFAVYAIARQGYARRIGLVALSFALFWFFTAQIMRYLIPVLPILCILASIGLSSLYNRFFGHRTVTSTLIIGVIAVLLLLPGLQYAAKRALIAGLPPVNAEARDRYLENRLPSYSAIRYLERKGGPSYTLYAYNDSYMAYYTAGEFRGDCFGPWRYSRLTGLVDGREDDLLHELEAMNINYLLVRDNSGGAECKREWLERRRVLPFFRAPGVALFEVSDTPNRVVFGPDLTCRAAWDSSFSHPVCVRTLGDVLYFASCAGTSSGPFANVAFQVVWMGENGREIRTDETTGTFFPGSDSVRIIATSPQGSSSALLSCSPLEGASIQVRSFSFRTIGFEPATNNADHAAAFLSE